MMTAVQYLILRHEIGLDWWDDASYWVYQSDACADVFMLIEDGFADDDRPMIEILHELRAAEIKSTEARIEAAIAAQNARFARDDAPF